MNETFLGKGARTHLERLLRSVRVFFSVSRRGSFSSYHLNIEMLSSQEEEIQGPAAQRERNSIRR
jgi:hypothetical protein